MSRREGSRPSLRCDPVSSAITPRPTWNCWPPLTRPTRGPERSRPAPHPQARVRGLRQAGVRAVSPPLQRPPLQPAPQPALRPAPAPLRKDPAHGGPDRRTQKTRAQRSTRLSAHRYRASGRRPRGKGLYHINAVDEVMQWEVVLSTPRISEAWLMPLLESILQQFPFVILNFHSDNGSEFINKTVAQLLDKLLIEQTKSRPRKSGDNGLVETKNAAIVRKHIGWGHIAPAHAAPINLFYTGFLNPYLNYHRPAAQAEVQIDLKGRKRRFYKIWQTPLENLLYLDRPQQFLRPGLSLATLKRVAATMSDTDAARRMQQAKNTMFEQIRRSA